MKIHAPIEAIIKVTGVDFFLINGEKTRMWVIIASNAPTVNETKIARRGDILIPKPLAIKIGT
jgi:hypothetical protein